MPYVCGTPIPEKQRMCRENYIAAMKRKREDTEHDWLMRTCPEYKRACEQEDRERKARVEAMAKRTNGSRITEPKVGEYKGHPTLTLPNGSKYGFTFGLSKAQAILDHLDAIRAFVGETVEQDHEDRAIAGYVSAGLGEDVPF